MTYPQMDPRRLDLTGTFGLRVANHDAAEVRIGTAGRWGQRVNLATNPSFEATSGTVVVRTNLATSPKSYTPAASGPHPGLGAGPYTGSAEIDGVRQAVDPLALVGGTTYVRLLIESGSVPVGDYFDGDESPDPDLTPAWTGAVNGSTSVLRGAAVAVGTYSLLQFRSTQWHSAGEASVRLVGAGDSLANQFIVAGNQSALGTLVPGRTYRTSLLLRHEGLSVDGARHLTLISSAGSSVWSGTRATSTGQLPTAAGVHRLTLTATLPEDSLSALLYFRPRLTRTMPSIWVDDCIHEDVTDLAAQWSALPDPKPTLDAWLDERLDTAYFDGDTESTREALHHWTGTPHASTSVQTLAWTPGD